MSSSGRKEIPESGSFFSNVDAQVKKEQLNRQALENVFNDLLIATGAAARKAEFWSGAVEQLGLSKFRPDFVTIAKQERQLEEMLKTLIGKFVQS